MKTESSQPKTALRVAQSAQRCRLAMLPSPVRLRLRANSSPRGIVDFRLALCAGKPSIAKQQSALLGWQPAIPGGIRSRTVEGGGIHHVQAGDALKLAKIERGDIMAQGQTGGGDLQIVRSDHQPTCFQSAQRRAWHLAWARSKASTKTEARICSTWC